MERHLRSGLTPRRRKPPPTLSTTILVPSLCPKPRPIAPLSSLALTPPPSSQPPPSQAGVGVESFALLQQSSPLGPSFIKV